MTERLDNSSKVSKSVAELSHREAQEHWSRQPCPAPAGLPHPGIEPRSPALQADSLPTGLSGKP